MDDTSDHSRASRSADNSRIGRVLLGGCQFLTLTTLLIWPWLLGGVLPNAHYWLAASAAVILLLALTGLAICERAHSVVPWGIWLLITAMCLATFQLIPLPMVALEKVAPTSAELWHDFASVAVVSIAENGGKSASEPRQEWRTISVSPQDTRSDLSKLWIAGVFLLAGSTIARNSQMTALFLWLIALNGGLLTLFGIVQRATWNGNIFWTIESPAANAFGPFINHNNAGGYLLICLAGACGIIAQRIHRRVAPSSVISLTRTGGSVVDRLRDRAAWFRLNALTLLNDPQFLFAFTLAVLIVGGTLLTLSRGAFLGLLVGGCFVAYLVSRDGFRIALPLAVVVAIGAVALVAWVQNFQVVQQRLATLLDSEELQSIRLLHLREAASMVPDFWSTGCGLGAYRYANSLYRSVPYDGRFLYVENQYVETIIVGGVIAVAILLAFAWLAIRDTWRLGRNELTLPWSVSIFAASLLGGQLLAAAFDFGWYIPANMIAFACSIGLVQRMARSGPGPNRPPRLTFLLASLLMIGFGVFSVRESRRIAIVQTVADGMPNYSRSERTAPVIESVVIRHEIERLRAAIVHRPLDPTGLEVLGRKWIRLARAQVFENLQAETGLLGTKALWACSSLPYLNVSAHSLDRAENEDYLAALRQRPEVTGPLASAHDCFRALAKHCPLSMKAHSNLAQLGLLVLGDSGVWRDEMSRAFALAPQDADLRWKMGIMEIHAGETERGCELLRQSVEMSGEAGSQLIHFACLSLAPETFACHALPQDARRLLELADTHLVTGGRIEFRQAVAQRAAELLRTAQIPECERLYLEARILTHQGMLAEAEAAFIRGIRRYPRYWDMHFAYGKMLEHQGQVTKALQRFDACAAARPDLPSYRQAALRLRRQRK
jgi:tetratricopeptide (TPR) repeat protein